MAIERNVDGYSALLASDPLAGLDIGNPRKWCILQEDFLAYEIAQAAGNPYTLTQTNGVDTIVGPTGILLLTLGGADNDAAELQLTESPFALLAGKRMFFEAKVNITLAASGTIAANEFFCGLATEQATTNFMAADGLSLAVDNCVGFVKFDAVATAAAVARKADVESTDAAVWTPTDGTYVKLAVYFDGVDSLTFYVDGVQKSVLTGDFPTGNMTPTLFIKAGEAKANILKCDYYLVAIER